MRIPVNQLAMHQVDVVVARDEPLYLLFNRLNVHIEPGLEICHRHSAAVVMELATNFALKLFGSEVSGPRTRLEGDKTQRQLIIGINILFAIECVDQRELSSFLE